MIKQNENERLSEKLRTLAIVPNDIVDKTIGHNPDEYMAYDQKIADKIDDSIYERVV